MDAAEIARGLDDEARGHVLRGLLGPFNLVWFPKHGHPDHLASLFSFAEEVRPFAGASVCTAQVTLTDLGRKVAKELTTVGDPPAIVSRLTDDGRRVLLSPESEPTHRALEPLWMMGLLDEVWFDHCRNHYAARVSKLGEQVVTLIKQAA